MPAVTNLVTLDEARTYLGITDTDQPGKLQMLIDGISGLVETFIGNAVIERQFTDKFRGGVKEFFLIRYPVVSVTSITDPNSNTVVAADYEIIETQGRLIHFGNFPVAVDTIGKLARWSVIYTAGRFADTSAVGGNFKLAALIEIALRWSQSEPGIKRIKVGDLEVEYRDPSGAEPQLISSEARQLLSEFVQVYV